MDLAPLKDAYWAIVADCLHLFHGYPADEARAAALDLRGRIEDPADRPPYYMDELFYNREAFDVACMIAKHELAMDDHRDLYLRVKNEHYGPIDWMYAPPHRSAA